MTPTYCMREYQTHTKLREPDKRLVAFGEPEDCSDAARKRGVPELNMTNSTDLLAPSTPTPQPPQARIVLINEGSPSLCS